MIPEDFWTEGDEPVETTEEREAREAYAERYEEAKAAFVVGLRELVRVANEDDESVYVADWACVTHILTSAGERSNVSAMSMFVPSDQPLIVTAGLITRAGHVLAQQ